MAVEKIKMNSPPIPKKSRLEMNVRQLLNKCELIAKEEAVDTNLRLIKYVESLSEMLAELKTSPEIESFSKPPTKEVLAGYTKRIGFLKGLIQTATLHSPTEKVKYLDTNAM
ncbi:vesicle transport protein USE1-like isoform X1 [Achroia grisella]|uniref:vesicle transport protein USE1-like isoform X1 n=1 Tax=Achroia grisella TaxID=688607 RepID=UPI0027D21C81|nr:vesicle transport protein USE1-like isoform X1 [Achroia grisella]